MEVFLNQFGEFLYQKIQNLLLMYLIVFCMLASIFFFLRYYVKLSITKIILTEAIVFLILYFLLISTFQNGKRLFDLKQFGLKIVTCINNYKIQKSKLPSNIDSLSPCLTYEDLVLAKTIVKYTMFSKESLNSPYKNSAEKPFKEDTFSITIYENFMGFYYLRYKIKENQFVYSDD
ncbi:MAG: hypothetical protein K1X86_11880 [Ignavibacteria bacterium]|nr:hypothetical protein [Ignavibacteria bacterium]